jgi:hypothetical protein
MRRSSYRSPKESSGMSQYKEFVIESYVGCRHFKCLPQKFTKDDTAMDVDGDEDGA